MSAGSCCVAVIYAALSVHDIILRYSLFALLSPLYASLLNWQRTANGRGRTFGIPVTDAVSIYAAPLTLSRAGLISIDDLCSLGDFRQAGPIMSRAGDCDPHGISKVIDVMVYHSHLEGLRP
ncbi:hypothetical protein BDR04DRAFT_1164959 [Suillus decipiens]|nr:hypothetical protein BDR04DRAFT_1164959 [Suillus decipiens]